MARTYSILPSDIIDPEHEELKGFQRFLFDMEVTNNTSKRIQDVSKNIKGGGQSTKQDIMNERRMWS